MTTSTTKKISVKMMTKIAMLSVLSFILYFIEIAVPIFPGFLKLDLSDLPALIGAFALGPVAGIAVEAIKNALHLLRTSTGGVGEIANFLIGIALVIPAAMIYKKVKSKSGAVIGLLVGTIVMATVGAFANYFVLIPFYTNFMPIDAIVGMGTMINPNIDSVMTLVLYGIVPFNIFKGLVVSLVTVMLYKRISPILTR